LSCWHPLCSMHVADCILWSRLLLLLLLHKFNRTDLDGSWTPFVYE
jgi:hypothetical protein